VFFTLFDEYVIGTSYFGYLLFVSAEQICLPNFRGLFVFEVVRHLVHFKG
jgi:hypothetical protein